MSTKPEILERLRSLADTKQHAPEVRVAAIEAIGELGGPNAVNILERIIQTEPIGTALSTAAIKALGKAAKTIAN